MKIPRTRSHWIAVALVVAALMLTLSEAWGQGQSTGAAAVFEGRPAMAGAQGGQGAQSGVAQGGLGVQGTDLATGDLDFKRDKIAKDKETGIAREQRSASKKVKKAAKQIVKRSRTGVGDIDSVSKVGD